MYNQINTDELKNAGQYVLSDVVLVSYVSADGNSNQPKRISIRSLVTEINVYESLTNKTLSGNIVLTDAQNVANHLPLTGYERIEFRFFTPGTSRSFDFTSQTGHPMFIYKISNRQGISARSQIYVLHFASREMITNEKAKVRRSLTNTIDNMVTNILRTELNSTKTIICEETKGIRKFAFTNNRPFEVFDMLGKIAESKRLNNNGLLFYETALGFNFKSYENLLSVASVSARPVVAKFAQKPANIRDSRGNRDIIKEMQSVFSFSINEQFNTLKNLRNGVYNAQVTSHDLFNKTFKTTNFDYATEYEKSFHTEHDGKGARTDNKGIVPLMNVGNGKTFTSDPETVTYFETTTSNIYPNIERPDFTTLHTKRLSQRLAFESMNISLQVPGFTGLSVGDLIAFELPAYEPAGVDNPLDIDPYMSGRYLIKSIRHKISTTNDKHSMALECIKDSVRVAYPEDNIDVFTTRENKDVMNVTSQNLDETTLDDLDDL